MTKKKEYSTLKWWFGNQYFPPNWFIFTVSIGAIIAYLSNNVKILGYVAFSAMFIGILIMIFSNDKEEKVVKSS